MNNGTSSEEYKPTMSDRMRKSRERIDELRAEAQAKARRAVRVTNNYAHDHPWRIASTSVALGFIVGLLVNSPRRPRKVVLKQPKPTIKVKAASEKDLEKVIKKHSSFSLIQAFMPLAMLLARGLIAARQKNQIRPHPTQGAPVPF